MEEECIAQATNILTYPEPDWHMMAGNPLGLWSALKNLAYWTDIYCALVF